jgi:hypothetical protein
MLLQVGANSLLKTTRRCDVSDTEVAAPFDNGAGVAKVPRVPEVLH